MVALTNNSATLSPAPLRVCAQNHRYRLGAKRCSKPSGRANLREAAYDDCKRLGSCSKDPIASPRIKFAFLFYPYVLSSPLKYVDWSGLQEVDPNAVPTIDQPIPNGGKNWDCNGKTPLLRGSKAINVFVDTCCQGTLTIFVYPRRCFEPGWEDGGPNRGPNDSDEELAKHFFIRVEVRYKLDTFWPKDCGQVKRWSTTPCDVYPARFISKMTGPWIDWPEIPDPTSLSDIGSEFDDAVCESVKKIPPGTTK
jgi:hypothetical protein